MRERKTKEGKRVGEMERVGKGEIAPMLISKSRRIRPMPLNDLQGQSLIARHVKRDFRTVARQFDNISTDKAHVMWSFSTGTELLIKIINIFV